MKNLRFFDQRLTLRCLFNAVEWSEEVIKTHWKRKEKEIPRKNPRLSRGSVRGSQVLKVQILNRWVRVHVHVKMFTFYRACSASGKM